MAKSSKGRQSGSTPALELLAKKKIAYEVHSYDHDSTVDSFGLEAAEKLKVDAFRVYKTLIASAIVMGKEELLVAIVPVNRQLDLKALAVAVGTKSASMAEIPKAERTTGYIAGGISPLGQKRPLRTVIDVSALEWPTVFVSAGRRGLEVEMTGKDLGELTDAMFSGIAR